MTIYFICVSFAFGAIVGIIFRELWVLRQRKRDEDRLAKYRPPVPPRVFSGDDGDMNGGGGPGEEQPPPPPPPPPPPGP